MNKNSIVEFNTGKVKGLFISAPYNTIVEECHFKDKEGNYKIIGLSNQLTEKQMSDELGLTYHQYLRFLGEKDITVNYSDFSNYWMVVVLN